MAVMAVEARMPVKFPGASGLVASSMNNPEAPAAATAPLRQGAIPEAVERVDSDDPVKVTASAAAERSTSPDGVAA
jgi:hypothetical protein